MTIPIPFVRLQGCGNNFTVIGDLKKRFVSSQKDLIAATRKLQDKAFGLGGDGVMIILPGITTDFEVAMHNPDGSLMGMCGNGIRCVVRYLGLEGLLPQGREISFLVEGRKILCATEDEGRSVRVNMGAPSFDPQRLPLSLPRECVQEPLLVNDFSCTFTGVSMGNPHAVIFVPDVQEIPFYEAGPLIENHKLFPRRTNVEFAQVLNRSEIKVRVWERGAGETLACGTGACATLVAAERLGLTGSKAQIHLPGGTLGVEYIKERDTVYLTGPAQEIARGELYPGFFV